MKLVVILVLAVVLAPCLAFIPTSPDTLPSTPYVRTDLEWLRNSFRYTIDDLGDRPSPDHEAVLSRVLGTLSRLQRSSRNGASDDDGFTSTHTSTPSPSPSASTSLAWFNGESTHSNTSPSLRFMIAVSSFEGMYLNSGIGTYYAALAEYLASNGHNVTILYTRMDPVESKTWKHWVTFYATKNIHIVRLPPASVRVAADPLVKTSYNVYAYLKNREEDFDVVHFPDFEGVGFYSLLAKHQGLFFSKILFIVGLHGPWRWVKEGNQASVSTSALLSGGSILTEVQELETDFMEQHSVQMADLVITPSGDLPEWLSDQGWDVPSASSGRLFRMPFLPGMDLLPLTARMAERSQVRKMGQELVFFGRLETRKGIELFCDALDILAMQMAPSVKITFMGKISTVGDRSSNQYINDRSKHWPFQVDVISYNDRTAAFTYLRQQNRIAVIPSLVDNAPYTVYECLLAGIPFVATDLPSIRDLVNENDRSDVLVPVNAAALASKIDQVITYGMVPARSALQISDVYNSWQAFYSLVHDRLADNIQKSIEATSPSSSPAPSPMVSLCLTHYNRPDFLHMALQSITSQTYPNFEVVLVDDGSNDERAIEYLNILEPAFKTRGWQIIRNKENKYLGAARNIAASRARGEYLVFLDDDNITPPNQISTYVSVAQRTGAELLTAAHDVFDGSSMPKLVDNGTLSRDGSVWFGVRERSVPLGPAVLVGLFKNVFGNANFFVKREAFLRLGGFTEDVGVGQEDHEFHAKAVLAGLHFEGIPESLLLYRMHDPDNQMIFKTDSYANQVRASRPYHEAVGDSGAILKVLANNRVQSRGIGALCNLTLVEILPSVALCHNRTVVNITVEGLDCPVSTIFVGPYECFSIIKLDDVTLQCILPKVPFPHIGYDLTVELSSGETALLPGVFDFKWQIIPQMTLQVVTLHFLAENYNLFNREAFVEVIAEILGILPEDVDILSVRADRAGHPMLPVAKRSELSTSATVAPQTIHVRVVIYSWYQRADPPAVKHAIIIDQNMKMMNDLFKTLGLKPQASEQDGGCDHLANCNCNPNYLPGDCTISAFCPNNCSTHGECLNGPLDRVCVCDPGWAGSDCSYSACPFDCFRHGSCFLFEGQTNGTCLCDPGYGGYACQVSCPNRCSGHGTCIPPNVQLSRRGTCSCNEGYEGKDCSTVTYVPPSLRSGPTATEQHRVAVTVVAVFTGLIVLVVIALIVWVAHRRRQRDQY
eukprot:TRINITY_DN544_c0_g1_i2.p1 TRINITY_DN544_c0_g1~~TRINITY_DN544_c0_g1_i2.p1  ORF type:complete len:1227 (+),score=186.85 TRINITY_DN544_c0_g1_i2:1343-5023(+)